jgi:hypothetical protein
MKVLFFILFIFCIAPVSMVSAQTKEEIQKQMQEAVSELKKQVTELEKQIADAKKNKEDPETIKELEDELAMLKKQLTMLGGLNKNVSMMSDKVVKDAAEEKETGKVPKKDQERIKQIPIETLTDAQLIKFLKKVQSEVERLINDKDKTEAQKIYTALKSEKRSTNYISNAVNALWISGNPEIALYILGKECAADMSNTNNLNNYAAFLTMTGGEQASIPILQNLAGKYPNNSTIQNNIGQAWFGLGDMTKAKKHLDNSMRAYGLHSQANQTMSMIQESEGKTGEAIESIKKSIKENYTPEKEARLNELGGKLEYDDLPFRYPAKAEPLGIEKFMFMIPAYPFEGGLTSERSQMEWDDFKRKVWDAKAKLEGEKEIKEQKMKAYYNRLHANPQILKPYNNTVYLTSARKLKLLYDWYTDRFIALDKKKQAAADTIKKWKTELQNAIEALGYDPQNPNKNCGKIKSLSTSFLLKANTLWQQRNAELLSLEKQKLNAEATYALYGTYDRSLYEMTILNIKTQFLFFLGNLRCEFEGIDCIITEVQKPPGKVLPDFDSLNCQYKEEFDIKPFTKIKIECNRMISEFDIDTELGLKVKLGMEENLNSGKITKGTIEIGVEKGTDVGRFGPVGAELKGGISTGVEFTSDGVQEVYIKGSSTIDLAGAIEGQMPTPAGPSDPKGLSTMSGEVKISWNVGSGPNAGRINSSLTGQGMLSPINLSVW